MAELVQTSTAAPPGKKGRPSEFATQVADEPGVRSLLTRSWDRISLRGQILFAMILVNLLAGIVAGIIIVYNARHAAQVEVAASMAVAERAVRETIERDGLGIDRRALFARVLQIAEKLRHVRIFLTDTNGGLASLMPVQPQSSLIEQTGVPDWFIRLVHVEDIRREMKIILNGRAIGSVVLIGNAGDEITEVWNDNKQLMAVALVLNLIVLGLLYFALGRLLKPLEDLATGLRSLEKGEFGHRLALPRMRELAHIARSFNVLADSLQAANAANTRLTRRLVTVQDEERRDIAAELHDEIGPCIFGIKANVASVEKLVGEVPSGAAENLRERLDAISEFTNKIQVLNRQLLGKLRPMALGHVPLADIVSGLVADIQRLNPKADISLSIGRIADSYGDLIDLTIYRCLQEGITNAGRHGRAKHVIVTLEERSAEEGRADQSEKSPGLLKLSISDDGRGMAPGTRWDFGLTGIDERVRALGGTFTISGQPGKGTHLDIAIPLVDYRRQILPGG